MKIVWSIVSAGLAIKPLALALVLLLLSLGLAFADESGPQWTATPLIKSGSSNSSSPSVNVSIPDLSNLNISGKEPSAVILGEVKIPYQEYQSRVRSIELWLESGANWTQYLEVHKGDSLELLAYTPSMGNGDLYLVNYANSSISHRGYHLQPGYYDAILRLEKVGRMMLILMVENQPSNALIIDVLPPNETVRGPRNVEQFSPGFAFVTISSDLIKGYDVYVDGVFYSSDIADGVLNGTASFKVGGDSIHTVTISKKGGPATPAYQSEHTKSFQSGFSYQLKI
jgi:hypothetical protein